MTKASAADTIMARPTAHERHFTRLWGTSSSSSPFIFSSDSSPSSFSFLFFLVSSCYLVVIRLVCSSEGKSSLHGHDIFERWRLVGMRSWLARLERDGREGRGGCASINGISLMLAAKIDRAVNGHTETD